MKDKFVRGWWVELGKAGMFKHSPNRRDYLSATYEPDEWLS
jgi:hypothetical protein